MKYNQIDIKWCRFFSCSS